VRLDAAESSWKMPAVGDRPVGGRVEPVIIRWAEIYHSLVQAGLFTLRPIGNIGPQEGGERVEDAFHLLKIGAFHGSTVGKLAVAGADQGGAG